MTTKKAVAPAIGEGMVIRKLLISARDVVFAKGIVEALEGVAQVFAEGGGDLILAAPCDREAELDSLAEDLARELGGVLEAKVGVPR